MDETFDTGVVAILDALGFKGIWQRSDPRQIIDKMQVAKRAEAAFARHGFQPQILFLSDTVVIACRQGESETRQALMFVCMRVAYFLSSMLTDGKPPMVYRGAIAAGRYLIEDNILLGPAVDEAAEAEKQPRGPFVWLTQSARGLLPRRFRNALSHGDPVESTFYLMPYRVPLLGQRVEDTYIVPPTVAVAGVQAIGSGLRQAVTDAPVEKRRHTEDLIDALNCHYGSYTV